MVGKKVEIVVEEGRHLGMLWQAMFMKSINLSSYGLITVENGEYDQVKAMSQKIANGTPLLSSDKQYCQCKSRELIAFLKPELDAIDEKCSKVLFSLSKTPISQRYRQRKTDSMIEKELDSVAYENDCLVNPDFRKIIDLQSIKAKTTTEWKVLASSQLNVSVRTIERYLTKMNQYGRCFFDKDIESYLLVA